MKKKTTLMAFVQTAPMVQSASPTELESSSFHVTPAIASAWLKKNTNNRALRPKHVAKLAELMKKGLYVPVLAEPISFDKNGNLSNGQHRLHAIIASGVSYTHPVVHGLDFNVFSRPMPVASRSRHDALTSHGIENSAIVSKMLPYIHGVHMGTTNDFHGGNQRITADEALDIYGYYPGIQDSVEVTRGLRSDAAFPTLQHVFASAHYLFSRVDAEKAIAYLAGVLHGENLPLGAPALAVRNRLQRDLQRADRKKLGPAVLATLIVGWNAYAAGKQLTILKMPSEFPSIYGFTP